jgi:hypothetical protein
MAVHNVVVYTVSFSQTMCRCTLADISSNSGPSSTGSWYGSTTSNGMPFFMKAGVSLVVAEVALAGCMFEVCKLLISVLLVAQTMPALQPLTMQLFLLTA